MPRVASVADVERALEALFRLTGSRRLQTAQQVAVGIDVTRAGYAVLRSLETSGPLSLSALAQECAMDPATVTRQVKALERDGLVRRDGSAHDARVSILRLTPRGRRVHEKIATFRTGYMTEVLHSWSGPDRRNLVELVDRLVGDLRTVPPRPTDKEHRR